MTGLATSSASKPANGLTDGRSMREQVARLIRRQIAARSSNSLKDTLGAVDEIVAMTDRVIEIA